MAEVTVRMLVTGQKTGHNVCTVSMLCGGAESILVSEGWGRTVLQAETDGFRMVLASLKEPCRIRLLSRSRDLLDAVKEADAFPHSVSGVHVCGRCAHA